MKTKCTFVEEGLETFPFAGAEKIHMFPVELRSGCRAGEKSLYASIVGHFNRECFENADWLHDPHDKYEEFSAPPGVDASLVFCLVDRLFASVSATLYRQAMPDGTWLLGTVRSLELVHAA